MSKMDKKEDCWMCDEKELTFIDKNFSSEKRMVDDSRNYYVIVPKDPLLFGHIMIVLKYHRKNLMYADEMHLQMLNEGVSKWTNILKNSFKDCRNIFLTCLCDSDRVHLHYHLFPVLEKEKHVRGYGHQWLGAHESISDMKRFDLCTPREKKERIAIIKKMVTFLEEKKSKMQA